MSAPPPATSAPEGIPAAPNGAVVTVGTFDGVHRGHWEVLQETRRRAEADGRRSVLATFHPHPLRIVRPDAAPSLLTTPLEKEEILAESGLDYAVFLSFTRALAGYSPERFVREILLERLHLRRLVIGYDHGLGKGRSGDVNELRRIGEQLGFEVHVVPAVNIDGQAISSSSIRRALQRGDVVAAAAGLGRPYSFRGPVIRGDGRGRRLGFPTANIEAPSPDKLLPREGIYAVRAYAAGQARAGVLHLGPRPVFQDAPPSIEVHLFDFDGDLYGDEVRVDFCERLRDIHAFASVEGLIAAIRADCEAARAVLARGAGACRGMVGEVY
jgi:riboflavin kinase/FMN adenylyltransferase